jgi:hypothetical protein
VNCDVTGFGALDQILGFFFAGVVSVALKSNIGNYLLHDNAANSTRFRIPFDMIATFERLGHL